MVYAPLSQCPDRCNERGLCKIYRGADGKQAGDGFCQCIAGWTGRSCE